MDESTALAQAAIALELTDVTPFARGGQKLVSRANRNGHPVILKVVMLGHSADPNALERCEREVKLLKSLASQNIVKVLSEMVPLGDPPTAAVWLEEELDGDDLSQLVGNQWSWSETAAFIQGIGSGLAAMHAEGYVHRDLSAGNVRRTSAGVWKVMDPGLAKHLNRTSITGVWQPGTPGYLSPEHAILGGRITPASDIFCLGILAYLALSGTFPIDPGRDRDEYRRNLLGVQPSSISVMRPDLTAAQVEILDSCLQRQPARRFLDAGELVTEMKNLSLNGGNK